MAWERMRRLYLLGLLYVVVSLDAHAAWLSFDIQNEDGQSLPCRIHLFDTDGKPQRAAGLPFYTELAQVKRHISKSSSRFFLDWVNERIERVKGNITDKSQQAEVLRSHESARKFWQERVRQSNAD